MPKDRFRIRQEPPTGLLKPFISRDLLDETDYIDSFLDFQNLVDSIYRGFDIIEVIRQHRLIVVGGQALAFWYARFFLHERQTYEFQAAYSDDLDFYGVKSSVEFCELRLGVAFNRPEDFNSTVNLAMTEYVIEPSGRKIIIDIIHEVGGLEKSEIENGTELLPMRGIDVPVINPLLCLRSRIHNFYAPYKADKVNELSRIALCIRMVNAYLTEMLVDTGWSKIVSRHCEALIGLCLSVEGRKLYCKWGVDILQALPDASLLNESFAQQRLPRARHQVQQERERMHVQLLRFDKSYTGNR